MPQVFDGEGIELNSVMREEHIGYCRMYVQGPVPRLPTISVQQNEPNHYHGIFASNDIGTQ
jgi:hypothetical protein